MFIINPILEVSKDGILKKIYKTLLKFRERRANGEDFKIYYKKLKVSIERLTNIGNIPESRTKHEI